MQFSCSFAAPGLYKTGEISHTSAFGSENFEERVSNGDFVG
jgi:hypothetical protein